MELAIGVIIRQLLLVINYATKFEAFGYAGVFPGVSLLAMLDDELRASLRLVGYQVLLRCQVTVAVGVGVWIWAAIRQVGEQAPFIVVQT